MHIKLTQPHTDAGKEYEAGDIITVDEVIGLWMINMKIGVEAPKTKVVANQDDARRRN